mmetsp:Transcript_11189/g.69066  ORF Transcript_11189/g.69066 Transcript_11189/m.69066 type:complete len:84 (+) Transcript_11189:460-711(+)
MGSSESVLSGTCAKRTAKGRTPTWRTEPDRGMQKTRGQGRNKAEQPVLQDLTCGGKLGGVWATCTCAALHQNDGRSTKGRRAA